MLAAAPSIVSELAEIENNVKSDGADAEESSEAAVAAAKRAKAKRKKVSL